MTCSAHLMQLRFIGNAAVLDHVGHLTGARLPRQDHRCAKDRPREEIRHLRTFTAIYLGCHVKLPCGEPAPCWGDVAMDPTLKGRVCLRR